MRHSKPSCYIIFHCYSLSNRHCCDTVELYHIILTTCFFIGATDLQAFKLPYQLQVTTQPMMVTARLKRLLLPPKANGNQKIYTIDFTELVGKATSFVWPAGLSSSIWRLCVSWFAEILGTATGSFQKEGEIQTRTHGWALKGKVTKKYASCSSRNVRSVREACLPGFP